MFHSSTSEYLNSSARTFRFRKYRPNKRGGTDEIDLMTEEWILTLFLPRLCPACRPFSIWLISVQRTLISFFGDTTLQALFDKAKFLFKKLVKKECSHELSGRKHSYFTFCLHLFATRIRLLSSKCNLAYFSVNCSSLNRRVSVEFHASRPSLGNYIFNGIQLCI